MNSPSAALIWEIWRKNRWGFALLVVLFAMCAGLSRVVIQLQKEADRLVSALPKMVEGTLSSGEVLSSLASAPNGLESRLVQFKLGSNVVYKGHLWPDDALKWSTPNGKIGWLRLTLGATTLFEGLLTNDAKLSWSVEGGGQGAVRLGFNPQYSEEVSQATMTAQNWREGVLAWSAMLMGFSFLVVCAIFSGAEPHSVRGFTGIPPRRFTLPVRTSELAGWPIVLG